MAAKKTHEELQLAIVNAKNENEKNAAIKEHNDHAASQLGKGSSHVPSATYGRLIQPEKKSFPENEVETSNEQTNEVSKEDAKPKNPDGTDAE